MYNAKFLDIFQQVSNYGLLRGANAIGVATDENTGDIVKLYLKIENGMILDSKFKAFGSINTIVLVDKVSSILANNSVSDARKITPTQIGSYFDDIQVSSDYAKNLVYCAINLALDDYEETLRKEQIKQLKAEGKEIPEDLKKPRNNKTYVL